MSILADIIREHIEYSGQLFKLARADIDKTYRGSYLGKAWAVVRPSVTIFVFWFAFGIGLRHGQDVDGYPFFFWLIAGMCPWFYMSDMLTSGAGSIRKYRHLVTKMKFPISTIPTFVSMSKLAVHLVILLIVIAIFTVFGYYPDKYMLQLPYYIICMFMFWTVWGLFSGMLSAMSNDFLNFVKSMQQALFWMSGIIYDARTVDIPWVRTVLLFNPVTFVANGYRNVFTGKIWFWESGVENLYFFIVLAVFFVLALWAYQKVRKDIPDVL